MDKHRNQVTVGSFVFNVVIPLVLVFVSITLGAGASSTLQSVTGIGHQLKFIAWIGFSLLFYGLSVLFYAGLQSGVQYVKRGVHN
ncbi:hypothetical protein [Haloarchaeobius baliensis]|uniref:hypothetical protein n=1 Tax=Haloarchaeobius baliensis TaxID=1670458 RepID=UPI003F8840D9